MTRIAYDLKGAAEASSISIRSLQYAIDEGALVAHYVGRKPLIHAGDLDAYIQSLPTVRGR